MDLDYILPFAGIPENSQDMDGLDDKSELAHMILVNLLRILGAVKNKKASRHFVTRPRQVILNTRHVDGRVQNGTARLRATEARYQTARVRSKQLVVLSIQVNNYT